MCLEIQEDGEKKRSQKKKGKGMGIESKGRNWGGNDTKTDSA